MGQVRGEKIIVTVDLKNTGKLTGKEVVQLYLHDEFASVVRPVKELKGFELTELKAGETKTVTFSLTDAELGFYNHQNEFVVEPGTFKVIVGGNSETGLSDRFEIKSL